MQPLAAKSADVIFRALAEIFQDAGLLPVLDSQRDYVQAAIEQGFRDGLIFALTLPMHTGEAEAFKVVAWAAGELTSTHRADKAELPETEP